MQIEQQVVMIFMGTNGYLDEIPLAHVQRFERELLELLELKHRDVMDEIAGKKDLPDTLAQKIHSIAKQFVSSFKVS